MWDEMADRGLALARSLDGEVPGGRQGKIEALLPRLHLALGRSYIGPGEGRDGFVVGRKKMTFVRAALPLSGEVVKEEAAVDGIQKRKCNGGELSGRSLTRKRPTLRNDHPQDLSSSFLEMVK